MGHAAQGLAQTTNNQLENDFKKEKKLFQCLRNPTEQHHDEI